jgi:hypothetical protein
MPYYTVQYDRRDSRGEHILTAFACIPADNLDHARERAADYVRGHHDQCDFSHGLRNRPPMMAVVLVDVQPAGSPIPRSRRAGLASAVTAGVLMTVFAVGPAEAKPKREVNPEMTVTTVPADVTRTNSRSFPLAEGVLRYLSGTSTCATLTDAQMRQVTDWLASGHEARLTVRASDSCLFVFQREVSEDGRM